MKSTRAVFLVLACAGIANFSVASQANAAGYHITIEVLSGTAVLLSNDAIIGGSSGYTSSDGLTWNATGSTYAFDVTLIDEVNGFLLEAFYAYPDSLIGTHDISSVWFAASIPWPPDYDAIWPGGTLPPTESQYEAIPNFEGNIVRSYWIYRSGTEADLRAQLWTGLTPGAGTLLASDTRHISYSAVNPNPGGAHASPFFFDLSDGISILPPPRPPPPEVNPVSVPAALPLLLSGLAGIGWLARRRQLAA